MRVSHFLSVSHGELGFALRYRCKLCVKGHGTRVALVEVAAARTEKAVTTAATVLDTVVKGRPGICSSRCRVSEGEW